MEENAIAGPSQSNDSEPPELSNSDSETTPTDPLTSAPTQSPICSICVKTPLNTLALGVLFEHVLCPVHRLTKLKAKDVRVFGTKLLMCL